MTQQLALNMLGFDPATQAELDAVNTALGNRATALEAKGLTTMSPVATTSGTSKDFTSIAAGAKQVAVALAGVSLSGTANLRIQIGATTAPVTSGYVAGVSNGGPVVSVTAGFDQDWAAAAAVVHGTLLLTLVDASTNTWAAFGVFLSPSTGANPRLVTGTVALPGALGVVRITSSNGTDTFDAGSVGVTYLV